jgi:hypothetical protein
LFFVLRFVLLFTFSYYMQPPALKTSHLAKFTLETLFYIFYNMPKDTLQVYAAKELYKREWRYHKELKLWFSRATNAAAAGVAGASAALGPDGKPKDAGAVPGTKQLDANGKEILGKDGKPLLVPSTDSATSPPDSNTYLYFDINSWERRIFRETHILQPNKFMTEEDGNLLLLPIPRHTLPLDLAHYGTIERNPGEQQQQGGYTAAQQQQQQAQQQQR